MEMHGATTEPMRHRLARYRLETERTRNRAAERAAQLSAEALEVERTSIWLLRNPGQKLHCIAQYTRSLREHSSGEVWRAAPCPSYVCGLLEQRVLAAEDAREHPFTSELADWYLDPNAVGSRLDAPIVREGCVLGVVCHEHVGEKRSWSRRDRELAASIADTLSLIFEQAERLEHEAVLYVQTERQFERQKMEALGRMARGLAHDFNNMLSVVSMGLGILRRADLPHGPLSGVTQRVEETLQAGQRLTQQLLAFGRDEIHDHNESSNAAAVIERMEPQLRAALGAQITLSLDLRLDQVRVKLEAPVLEQVLLGLIAHARVAPGAVRRIELTLRAPRADEQLACDSVVLEIHDDGAGMEEDCAAHLFEPYFAGVGSASRLGLASVHGIVRRAGGSVHASTAPGAGITVSVALPVALRM